eukprot:1364504-Amorphochlora_amoeboformis.AAC.1
MVDGGRVSDSLLKLARRGEAKKEGKQATESRIRRFDGGEQRTAPICFGSGRVVNLGSGCGVGMTNKRAVTYSDNSPQDTQSRRVTNEHVPAGMQLAVSHASEHGIRVWTFGF